MLLKKMVYFIFWVVNFFVALLMITASINVGIAKAIIDTYVPPMPIFFFKNYQFLVLFLLGVFYLIVTLYKLQLKKKNSEKQKAMTIVKENGNKIEITFQTLNESIKSFILKNDYIKRITVSTYEKKESLNANIQLQVLVKDNLDSDVTLLKSDIQGYVQKTFGIEIKQINITLS